MHNDDRRREHCIPHIFEIISKHVQKQRSYRQTLFLYLGKVPKLDILGNLEELPPLTPYAWIFIFIPTTTINMNSNFEYKTLKPQFIVALIPPVFTIIRFYINIILVTLPLHRYITKKYNTFKNRTSAQNHLLDALKRIF